jgi:YegS/Rv2252/BmrU family lipid kinase
MRRRFFLIINPGAGIIGSSLVERSVAVMEARGATITRATPASFGELQGIARGAVDASMYDAVIAAGGDGTIRRTAAALIGTGMPLGIIPVGTANVLATEIGLSAEPQAIARMLLEGAAAGIACGSANREPFLLMAGVGFDARVVGGIDHRLKSRLGKLAYARPVFGALVRPVDTLSVTVDNQHHEASWVVVANARHYGGRFVLAPRAGIQERGLEAILFKAKSRAVLLGQLMSLVRGRLDERAARRPDVHTQLCSHVKITARHPVPAQIDGDLFGTTPLEISSLDQDLQLIVPASLQGMGNSER